MDITIQQRKDFSSRVFSAPSFMPEQILPRDKAVFAVVDASVQWFFDRHLSGWGNVKALVIPDIDESMKTMATVERILSFLLASRAERSSILLAIGGGIVLDTAGFAASICKRGIPWIGIPTTLLAQVDASIGGKTAVNADAGKNIIGTFYPPIKVLITPEVSETWSETHRLEGIAEMYKIFRVFDHTSAWTLVDSSDTRSLLSKSVQLKANVVRIDPWEKSLRGVLNYGHTFAHAFEYSTGLRHGLAVALGIRCENCIAEHIGLMPTGVRTGIDQDLDRLGFTLPDRLPPFDSLVNYILQDKKNVGGKVRLSLIDGLKELPMTEDDPTRAVEVTVLKESYKKFCEQAGIAIK